MEPDNETCYGSLELDQEFEGTCDGGEQTFPVNSSAAFLPGGGISIVEENGFTCSLSPGNSAVVCTPTGDCGEETPCGTCPGWYKFTATIPAGNLINPDGVTTRSVWVQVIGQVLGFAFTAQLPPGHGAQWIVNALVQYEGSGPNGPANLTTGVSFSGVKSAVANAGAPYGVSSSINKVSGSQSETPSTCPGEEYPCSPGQPSVPSVTVRYTGCFPPPEPSGVAPQPDPGPPDPDPPFPPAGIVSEGASEGGTGNKPSPNTRTYTSSWPSTPATPGFQINPTTNEPYWPIYSQTNTDWYLFLPPLFTIRQGAAPTLSPWNGVAFYPNAPEDASIETGVIYRAAWAAPPIHVNDLASNKRVSTLTTVFDNRDTRDVWSSLTTTDDFQWGSLIRPSSANISVIREETEGETFFDLYDYDTVRYPYNPFNVPDRIVFSESFKGIGARLQAMVWSNDEKTWHLEGFQIAARTRGTRLKTNRNR